jgi:uncharacterized protein (DUF885 family)
MNKQFEGMLDRYFEAILQDHPVYATGVGLKSGEGKLHKATPEFEARQQKRRLATLRALEEISPRDLAREQHLDRLALRSSLLRECEDHDHGRDALEPDGPAQVLDILLHELIRGDDEPKRGASNLRSLLDQTPRFLSEAIGLLDKPEKVWLKIMRQTTDGADALFTAVETFLGRVVPEPKDKARISSAKRALRQYRDKAEDRPTAPAGSFAIGGEAMQRRVRDQLGLDYTLAEIETLALGETRRIGPLLKKAARGRNPVKVIDEARSSWRPEKPLLELYKSTTTKVASAFGARRAVTFPKGDELEVRPVPDFMRPLFPTAAYSSPGALEKRQRGIFWVNDLSVVAVSPAAKLKEQQQHFGLSLTCAHEAYPGHHLQFVTANQHARKWRRLFAHAVFYEGWTLWCEQMMVDLHIDKSPWLRIQQLHDALWRAHRILVDIRLQTRRYSYDQAVMHMQKHLGFTKARAEGDVNWYTAQPSVPMSYWLGRLENERLRERLMARRGWSLQRFNDWLLSFGTLPQSWIEKYGLD